MLGTWGSLEETRPKRQTKGDNHPQEVRWVEDLGWGEGQGGEKHSQEWCQGRNQGNKQQVEPKCTKKPNEGVWAPENLGQDISSF